MSLFVTTLFSRKKKNCCDEPGALIRVATDAVGATVERHAHSPRLTMSDEQPATADDPAGQPIKGTHRAARKAAAARLARQRHKSFVGTLQGAIDARRQRIALLKMRKDDYFAAAAAHMIRGLRAHLNDTQSDELRRWARRSPKLDAAWEAPSETAWLRTQEVTQPTEGGECSSSSAPAPAPARPAPAPMPAAPAATKSPEKPPADTMELDLALARQAFLSECLSDSDELDPVALKQGLIGASVVEMEDDLEAAFDMAEGDIDEEMDEDDGSELEEDESEDESDFYEDFDEADLALQGVEQHYGDGLTSLLRHLLTDRQPTVRAWLQLRDDDKFDRVRELSKWTDLTALEEDFLLMNSEHRPETTTSLQSRPQQQQQQQQQQHHRAANHKSPRLGPCTTPPVLPKPNSG